MPIKDPDARREYHQKYMAQYCVRKADDLRQRRAKWYQANKERLRLKERLRDQERRHLVAGQALTVVTGPDAAAPPSFPESDS
ncbi:MAG: hypothetical protein JWO94_264 [Verrucomicrobiaceae bacterium]|nr:hypothetical protein [Verrucomicrobiaceae bacterium]